MILFIKDIEKSIVGNPEAYAAFKSKLDNLPENIVIIGSHTQMDSRKEKVTVCDLIHYCSVKLYFTYFNTGELYTA